MNFSNFMETARQMAKDYIQTNLDAVNTFRHPLEERGIVYFLFDHKHISTMGLVVKDEYQYITAIMADGIEVTPQDSMSDWAGVRRFFKWEDLDHENDVLQVAEFLQFMRYHAQNVTEVEHEAFRNYTRKVVEIEN